MAEINQLDIDPFLLFTQQTRTYTDLADAIDLASDQGQRTWVRWGGKRVAMIVPVEDGERLEKLEPDCTCDPDAADWLDDCPRHGHKGCAATQAYGATGCT